MTRSLVRTSLVLLTLIPMAGCSELFGPDDRLVEDGELTIIPVASDAPPLNATEVSFWAVKGEHREVQIQYRYPDGSLGKCLRFVVPSNALLRHPNRQLVAAGDSVEITVKVVDPDGTILAQTGGRPGEPVAPTSFSGAQANMNS